MQRHLVGVLVSAFLVVGGLYAWARLRSEMGGAEPPGPLVIGGPERHVVTKQMEEASRQMVERSAPPFEAEGTDGRDYQLAELRRRGPVVLTFVKNGCPCSEAAQPFFNRMHASMPGASFFGVIDVDAEKARRWASRFHVSYPLLLDPAYRIVRDYHAENSAYVVVIDEQGRILKHWPGYSAGMLRELAATLGDLTGRVAPPFDVADAPVELYSGCPYEL